MTKELHINDKREYVPTSVKIINNVERIVESDHNVLVLTLNLSLNKQIKPKQKKIYNLKNKNQQCVLNQHTKNCPELTAILMNTRKPLTVRCRDRVKKIKSFICDIFS